MKKFITGMMVSLAATGLICTTSANAQEEASQGPSISFSLTGATEYVWRGTEQSDGNPAVFGAVNISHGAFYAGAGAENVDFLGISTEYDLWAGWKTSLSEKTTLDLGVVRYGYIDAPNGVDLDTVELKAGISHAFDGFSMGATLMITDDFFATEESAQHIEVNFAKPLAGKWSLSGSVGHQMLNDDAFNYTHWNIGASYAATDDVTLDIRYIDTDADYMGGAADERIVASFSVGL